MVIVLKCLFLTTYLQNFFTATEIFIDLYEHKYGEYDEYEYDEYKHRRGEYEHAGDYFKVPVLFRFFFG